MRDKFKPWLLAAGSFFISGDRAQPPTDKRAPLVEPATPGQTTESEIESGVGKKINSQELSGLLKDKKIVIFGETHRIDQEVFTADATRFISLLPTLKEGGYDTVGLELLSGWQEHIDKFVHDYKATDNPKEREVVLNELCKSILFRPEQAKEQCEIIEAANYANLKVKCIDFRDKSKEFKRGRKRDKIMADYLSQEIDQGHRVAVFIGSDHASNAPEVTWEIPLPGGGEVTRLVTFEPLAHQLQRKYGASAVVSVSLDEERRDIPYFYEQ